MESTFHLLQYYHFSYNSHKQSPIRSLLMLHAFQMNHRVQIVKLITTFYVMRKNSQECTHIIERIRRYASYYYFTRSSICRESLLLFAINTLSDISFYFLKRVIKTTWKAALTKPETSSDANDPSRASFVRNFYKVSLC